MSARESARACRDIQIHCARWVRIDGSSGILRPISALTQDIKTQQIVSKGNRFRRRLRRLVYALGRLVPAVRYRFFPPMNPRTERLELAPVDAEIFVAIYVQNHPMPLGTAKEDMWLQEERAGHTGLRGRQDTGNA